MLAAGEGGRHQYIHVAAIRAGRQIYVFRRCSIRLPALEQPAGSGEIQRAVRPFPLTVACARPIPLAARDGMSSEGAWRQVCAQGVQKLVDQVFTDLGGQHGVHSGGHLFAQ